MAKPLFVTDYIVGLPTLRTKLNQINDAGAELITVVPMSGIAPPTDPLTGKGSYNWWVIVYRHDLMLP